MALPLLAWTGCAGPAPKVVAPADLPEVCRDLDFNREADLRDICGVRTLNFKAYRNLPEHRDLLQPKNGQIIRKGGGDGERLELRLEKTLPVELPDAFRGKFRFSEEDRRRYLKSRMDYLEYFPAGEARLRKVFRLRIPSDAGDTLEACYAVEPAPAMAQRNAGYASKLAKLECGEFVRLRAEAEAGRVQEGQAGNPRP